MKDIIRIRQIRSGINRPLRQKNTLKALGLKKMNQVVEHSPSPQILGMVHSINHSVVIEK